MEWQWQYVVLVSGLPVLYVIMRRYFAGGRCTSERRLDEKTAVVTGANCGIGLETARDLAKRGARVIIACRDVVKGNAAADDIRASTGNGNVVVYRLNLANLADIRACAKQIIEQETRLDILINNAGVMAAPTDAKTDDGFELQIGTNHLGHFLLTNILLEKMKQSAPSRIVNVSSSAHRGGGKLQIQNLDSAEGLNKWELYGRSKLANILFNKALHKRLEGSGVTCYALHPGVIKTNLLRHLNTVWEVIIGLVSVLGVTKTTVEGAQTQIYCAVEEGIEQYSGMYFADCQVTPTSLPEAEDDELAEQLWAASADLVGLQN